MQQKKRNDEARNLIQRKIHGDIYINRDKRELKIYRERKLGREKGEMKQVIYYKYCTIETLNKIVD